jgi:hypothetical protein
MKGLGHVQNIYLIFGVLSSDVDAMELIKANDPTETIKEISLGVGEVLETGLQPAADLYTNRSKYKRYQKTLED